MIVWITLGCTVLGWFVGHVMASKRSLVNKKREMRCSYLIDAYRRIEDTSQRAMDENKRIQLESAVADIQLFGTLEQIEMARECAQSLQKDSSADFTPLLKKLRNDLRKELKLEAIPDDMGWTCLRMKNDKNVARGVE